MTEFLISCHHEFIVEPWNIAIPISTQTPHRITFLSQIMMIPTLETKATDCKITKIGDRFFFSPVVRHEGMVR